MFNQVRRMVRVNSRSMIIVITFFFVLLWGRFTQSAAVAANTSLSLSAYSLDTQPSGSETSGLIGTAIAVVGGIVTFLTAVVTYFRTVRERKGETMTDALPVAQLSLALDAQEEEGKEDLKKRRAQRETQATGWLMYGLAFLIVPLQLVFTLVLPSIFTGGPGLGSSTVNRGQAAHSASSNYRGFLPRHLGSSAGGTGKINNSSSDQRWSVIPAAIAGVRSSPREWCFHKKL